MEEIDRDERVVAVIRRHWISLVRPLVWALAIGAIAGALTFLAPASIRTWRHFGKTLYATGSVFWLLLSWSALSEWASTLYAITPKRIMMRRGILRRQVIEVATAQVGRCSLRQGMLGRLLGFGTVRVELQNGSWWTMRRVSHPHEFVAGVNSALEGARSKG